MPFSAGDLQLVRSLGEIRKLLFHTSTAPCFMGSVVAFNNADLLKIRHVLVANENKSASPNKENDNSVGELIQGGVGRRLLRSGGNRRGRGDSTVRGARYVRFPDEFGEINIYRNAFALGVAKL